VGIVVAFCFLCLIYASVSRMCLVFCDQPRHCLCFVLIYASVSFVDLGVSFVLVLIFVAHLSFFWFHL
jgi:hypothetical protein